MRTLADHIFDIVENSTRAGATLIEIMVDENKKKDICKLKINDNGCGMDSETLKLATNPFFTSRKTRKVGLGLALLKQMVELANGKFSIYSTKNVGTKVMADFQISNIDRQPMGDIWESFYLLLLSNKNINIIYQHKTEKGDFEISSTEIYSMFEGISLQNTEVKNGIVDYIKNNLKNIESKI